MTGVIPLFHGVKQSGIPDLRMASLTDYSTIEKARIEAQRVIDNDPILTTYPKLKTKIKEIQDMYIHD